MVRIVDSRLKDDGHDWMLIHEGKYKCALCEYTMSVEPIDTLILRSGCPKSKVVLAEILQEATA